MNLAQIGEFGAIGLFQKELGKGPVPDIGIGDDAAVWRPTPGRRALLTTDLLIEDVHFSLDWTNWGNLGWKAMAVNISDIAAMGGVPRAAFVSCGLSPEMAVDDAASLYSGLAECAQQYGAGIFGGDTVASPLRTVINVALYGETLDDSGEVLRRDTAKPGDAVGVTNPLGGAAAALRMLQAHKEPGTEHLRVLMRPYPRVEEGQRLLAAGIRCAMDVSDGLVADLGKICAASGVGADIRLDGYPRFVWGDLGQFLGDEAVRVALTGGEDYELLACGPRELLLGQNLLIVGEITRGKGVRVLDENGRKLRFPSRGYDAFASRG